MEEIKIKKSIFYEANCVSHFFLILLESLLILPYCAKAAK